VSEARWAWSGQYNGEETRAGGIVGAIRPMHSLNGSAQFLARSGRLIATRNQTQSCAPRKSNLTKPPEGLRPWRDKECPPVFHAAPRCACVDWPPFPFRSSPRGEIPSPCTFAAPASVGQGQGVFVSEHSKAIQDGGFAQMNHERHQRHYFPSLDLQSTDGERVIAANVKLLIEQLEAGLPGCTFRQWSWCHRHLLSRLLTMSASHKSLS
jgi:hypothetical protein